MSTSNREQFRQLFNSREEFHQQSEHPTTRNHGNHGNHGNNLQFRGLYYTDQMSIINILIVLFVLSENLFYILETAVDTQVQPLTFNFILNFA